MQESDYSLRGPHQQHHLMERMKHKGHDVLVIDFDVDWNRRAGNIVAPRRTFLTRGKVLSNAHIPVIRPTTIRLPILCYLAGIVFHTIEIIRTMKRYKPDAIIGLGILNTLSTLLISKIFHVPFVYYLIDSLHTLIPERRLRPFGLVIEALTLRKSKNILVINRQLADYALRLGAEVRPIVISAGIDSTRFNPTVDGSALRESLGFGPSDIVLFFMGWLYEFSGLLEVAYDVVRGDSGTKLLILGKGDLYSKLSAISLSTTNGERIVIKDWIPYESVPSYIAASDICILPAYCNQIMESIVPIKMYEYLACGKPVVTTKLPGIMKEFGRGNGVIYAADPNDVVRVIGGLIRDNLLAAIGNQGWHYAKNQDWDMICDRFEYILRHLCD